MLISGQMSETKITDVGLNSPSTLERNLGTETNFITTMIAQLYQFSIGAGTISADFLFVP